jgi:hypothetical protein
VHVDDAAAYIVDVLQTPRPDDGFPTYGYDIWLPKVVATYIREVEHSTEHLQNLYDGQRATELSLFFYDAAWVLCRRGIIRPGVKDRNPYTSDGPCHGNGVSASGGAVAKGVWLLGE